MKQICANFESWHLSDGNYPLMHKGQKVNLSFCLENAQKEIMLERNFIFQQIKDSQYYFAGEAIRLYKETENEQIIIVDTGDFKFYIEDLDTSFKVKVGDFIKGQGTLFFDYYIWVEFLDHYDKPPNLFYNFRIDKIRGVEIREKFTEQSEKFVTSVCSLTPKDYVNKNIVEIENMKMDSIRFLFYLIDLTEIDEEIQRTFI